MRYQLTVRLALLALVYSILPSSPICAQLPPRLEKCLPDPTLAQEIRGMLEETTTSQVKDLKLTEAITETQEETAPRVTIDRITFQGKLHLPKSITAQIATRFERTGFETPEPWHAGAESIDSDWLEFFRETAREAWEKRGYYNANVGVQTKVSGGDPIDQRVSLTVHVDEGPRFHLGKIQFVDAHVLPLAELRKAFPLREGDIFDLGKARHGIEALKRQYDTRGYINFVATPDVQVDMAHRRISLVVYVEEGKQFRVGNVAVLALDPHILEGILRTKLRPGDIFNPELIREFYNENKSLLPPDASLADWDEKQNEKDATVDIVFDFRDCPKDP